MNKKYFSALGLGIILSILFLVGAVHASTLSVNGWPNSACNTQNSTSFSITENRSFYITNAWIGGNGSWDDEIGFSGTFNGAVVAYQTAGWGGSLLNSGGGGGCDSHASASPASGYTGFFPLSMTGSTDTDSFVFALQALQKRDEMSSTNTFHGSIEYSYDTNYCSAGQYTLNNSCVWDVGTITATVGGTTVGTAGAISCTAPCNPNISWNISSGLPGSGQIRKNNVAWNTGNNSGNVTDSGLTAGTYSYDLYIKDGFGNYYGLQGPTITVTAAAVPAPTASLTFSDGSKSKPMTPNSSVTYSWSSTNGSSYTSTYTSSSCGSGSAAPMGNGASGSNTQTFGSTADPCAPYTMTYKVTNSSGVSASDSVTLTAPAAPTPTATLSVPTTLFNLTPTTLTASETISNTIPTNGGSFVIGSGGCAVSPGTFPTGTNVYATCPTSLGPNAGGTFSVQITPTPAPGNYSATVTITATGQNGTVVSNRIQAVTLNYAASAPPPPTGTMSLTANPTSITSGTSSSLFYTLASDAAYPCGLGTFDGTTFTNMLSIYAGTSGGVMPTGNLSNTTSYRLRCPSSGTTYSFKDATVTVTATPPPPPPPPPVGNATLTATPTSGTGSVTVGLLANNSDTGEFYFYFYCNRIQSDSPPPVTNGFITPQTFTTDNWARQTCVYSAPGTYYPKVIAWRIYDDQGNFIGGNSGAWRQAWSAPIVVASAAVNGVCGASNGGTFSSAPATNLCSVGTASAVTGTGPWNWSCAGSGGGSSASCSAALAAGAFDFSMSNGGALSIPRGSSGSTSITSTLVSGSAAPVTFTANPNGLYPALTGTTFSSASCTPTCAVNFTVNFSSFASVGESGSFTITGTGGGNTHTTNVNFTVTASGGGGGMSGTLTPASPSCAIASGANSCNVNLTWSTANPVGTSAVTATGMANVNGNSGSQAFVVPYSSRTFYLYNNAVLLAQTTASSSCAAGNSWNGSSCVPPQTDGVCSATHYNCSAGTSANNVSGTSAWTWSCSGLNGGASPSCSETKNVGNGGSTDGVCASTHYNCSAGTSANNVSGTSAWTWSCSGLNGGASPSCSELKKKPIFIEN